MMIERGTMLIRAEIWILIARGGKEKERN